MNIANPIGTAIPSSHGAVLEVLAKAGRPLTGRGVAALTDGRVSQRQTSTTLHDLVATGLVLQESYPPANLYRLNRDHVAADAVVQLAGLRDELIDRMRLALESWDVPPKSAWLFGSFARGQGDESSDVDICLLRPESIDIDDETWTQQLDELASAVLTWSGNTCSIVELTAVEYSEFESRGERITAEIARDGITLAGSRISQSVSPRISV